MGQPGRRKSISRHVLHGARTATCRRRNATRNHPTHTPNKGVRTFRVEAFALLCTAGFRDGFAFDWGFQVVSPYANMSCIALGHKGDNGGVLYGRAVLDCLRRDVLAARSRLDCASINIRIEQQARHA